MSDLPDTNDYAVVLAAIAWEIVQQSHEDVKQDHALTQQGKLKHLVNAWIDAYAAIDNQEKLPIES